MAGGKEEVKPCRLIGIEALLLNPVLLIPIKPNTDEPSVSSTFCCVAD